MLPVYRFDPTDYENSSSGFDKTSPFRATFFSESVSDLRKNLQAKRSDLVVRIGKPKSVLVELAKAVGVDESFGPFLLFFWLVFTIFLLYLCFFFWRN